MGAMTHPEPQPVVAAIVTSPLGVLAGRRNDGVPPWTFIAGEIEPGESAADAAVREVKEETGLTVIPGKVIARRVHPRTERAMIYVAAVPVSEPGEVFVGDEVELAEVRWLNLPEAMDLMPDMYGPVATHLIEAMQPDAEVSLSIARPEYDRAMSEMLKVLREMPDPVRAFQETTSLHDDITAVRDRELKPLRARLTTRAHRVTGGLTMKALGSMVGLTKGRISQLVAEDKKNQEADHA
jgi:8-oxo-dGTP pyrophosphatase MutT (NUDIX family)